MGRIRRGEARDKDYDRLNKVGAKKHADDAEPTVRARRFFFFDPRHRLTSYVASMAWGVRNLIPHR